MNGARGAWVRHAPPARRAFLAAALLWTRAWSQAPDTSEQSQERGFPWIAQTSAEGFYLASPLGGASQPYQVSAYQGFTIQSLRFAWFHVGLRSRETLAPGLSGPYRDPFDLKLAGVAELMRNRLFLSLGGSLPFFATEASASDSLALSRTLSGYSPLPAPAFLSPTSLHGSLFARYGGAGWDAMAGLSLTRPGRFEPIPGEAFYLSPYANAFLRLMLETSKARHRWDAKATVYGQEGDAIRIPAHDEGDLWQLRYGYLKPLSRLALQTGAGVAMKSPDANRQRRIRSALEPTGGNDNIQRAYAELSVVYAPGPGLSWRMHLIPKALFSLDGREIGHETELGLALGLRLWTVHRLRGSGSLLYGQVGGKDYLGMGFRVEFALRHLGFLDLEDGSSAQSEPTESAAGPP